jgi:parvulin-like peptidyl-prolyl isomerase
MDKHQAGVLMMAVGLTLASCGKNSDYVIARIGKEKVTEGIFSERLASMPREYQNYAKTPYGRKQFIDAIVREAIVVKSAKKAGVNKRTEYKNSVKDFKLKQKKQFVEYKNGLLIETYIKEIHKNFCPTELDIKKYFNTNKDLFENPKSYVARHIVVSNLQTAKKAYERLQNGENFESVAKEVSRDNSGLIGPFRRGELIPEFEQAVVNLKNNEISNIVETPYGYHIILKLSEEKLSPVSFEEEKEKIKRILEKEKFNEWFAQKKQEFRVKIAYDIPTGSATSIKK